VREVFAKVMNRFAELAKKNPDKLKNAAAFEKQLCLYW